MSDIQDQNKTEEATPRRRERARDEGQVVFSPDLTAGAMLSAVSIFCFFTWPVIHETLSVPLFETFTNLRLREWGITETLLSAKWLLSYVLMIAGLMSLLTTGSALLVTHFQSGFTMTTQPLTPKWDKISPTTGWEKLLSLDSIFRGVLAILKLATSIAVALTLFSLAIQQFRMNGSGTASGTAGMNLTLLLRMMLSLSAVTFLWGVADYAIRWIRNEQKLKMSKQEVKDEQKEEQVDPQIRSRIRRAQQEAVKRKSLQEVPKATMVITNPTHYAVALKYHTGTMAAPVVIAKGADAFALRIKEVAKENGVPVFERKPLTRAVFALAEVGDEIPAEFYRAIAELLANVYRIKGQAA